MTADEFVSSYMYLTNKYLDMSDQEREDVTTAFVRYRAVHENWSTIISEDM